MWRAAAGGGSGVGVGAMWPCLRARTPHTPTPHTPAALPAPPPCRSVSLSDVLAEGADEPLLLLAEWQEAAQQRYEAAPLLQAEAHASAAALAERHRDGGKSVSLADCLEVGTGGVGVPGGRAPGCFV